MGPGSVLSAAIMANAVPVVDLRDIFRQARQSNIVTSAHDIHCGRFPSLAPVPPRLPVRGPATHAALAHWLHLLTWGNPRQSTICCSNNLSCHATVLRQEDNVRTLHLAFNLAMLQSLRMGLLISLHQLADQYAHWLITPDVDAISPSCQYSGVFVMAEA